jgi:DUF4097 and DUF4098 domain-containing protein YvlB
MRTTRIITMVCWIIVAVVLLGMAIWFLTGSLFGIPTGFKFNNIGFNFGFQNLTGPYNEVGSYSISADNIDSLDVDWVAGAVSIKPYDGNDIKFTEYAQRELNDREKLQYDVSGDTLSIWYKNSELINIMVTKKLEVLVPADLADELDKLLLDATSAEVYIDSFTVDRLEIEETSGEAMLSNITSGTLNANSVSGTITITDSTADDMILGSTSGEIELSNVVAASVITDSTSGEQTLSGSFGRVDAGSVSGEIDVRSSTAITDLYCDTVSGSVSVTIPESENISVSYSTTSGDFSSDIPVLLTEGSAALRFSTVSGDINIYAFK